MLHKRGPDTCVSGPKKELDDLTFKGQHGPSSRGHATYPLNLVELLKELIRCLNHPRIGLVGTLRNDDFR